MDPERNTFVKDNLDFEGFRPMESVMVNKIAKIVSIWDCIKGKRDMVEEISILLIHSCEYSLKSSKKNLKNKKLAFG